MGVDWTEVNERRISEKTQEIRLYCSRKKADMTPRSFELAQISFGRLLDNISDRNPQSAPICKTIQRSMESQDEVIATCSEKQAAILARGVVYNYIGDDLDLYPITAEQKLLRSKVRNLGVCDIPKDEMTTKDFIFVASAIAEGENISKTTMRAVFEWFGEIGLDPIQTRVYSVLLSKQEPMSLTALPQQNLFGADYRKAAKALVEKGFISELPGNMYCVTETTIA